MTNQNEKLPTWDNSSEYPSFQGPTFKNDIEVVKDGIEKIKTISVDFKKDLELPELLATEALISAIDTSIGLIGETSRIIHNLMTFTFCETSLDANNQEAKKILSQLKMLFSETEMTSTPINLYLRKTSEDNFSKIISQRNAIPYKFHFESLRKRKQFLLSEKEEKLFTQLNTDGHEAWGDLYKNISGTARVEINLNDTTTSIGIAQAYGMTAAVDEPTRKAAWQGLQNTWTIHQESAAMILNSLAGWRHEINKTRSHTIKTDYLDETLFNNRIKSETLTAMMAVVSDHKTTIQNALKTMAQYFGKHQFDPWDLLAPAPLKGGHIPFAEGFTQVKNSFNEIDPKMGEFAQMMLDNNWIDSSVRPNKRNGGYCTGFTKSKTPRVFQTYKGSSLDVSTLAHELGHAYHSWVIRDLDLIQQEYPVTLAETASIFSEQILFDHQISNAKTKEEKLNAYWSILKGAESLLLNIPVRFEFEQKFYEKRKTGMVPSKELSDLMEESFKNWYGDALSKGDRMFWATKLHFSIAGQSFYNFPYTFGYLFSLSIYARRKDLGSKFSQTYINILRDTGIMTAEDLIQKHLGEDITKKEFWQKSIDIVLTKIKEFQAL